MHTFEYLPVSGRGEFAGFEEVVIAHDADVVRKLKVGATSAVEVSEVNWWRQQTVLVFCRVEHVDSQVWPLQNPFTVAIKYSKTLL